MRGKRGVKGRPLPGLKAARERQFLTQKELAEMAGLTQATVWSLETGEHRSGGAYPTTIRRLAKALGVDPMELVRAPEREEELV